MLIGKTAVITGAGGEIGRATARLMAKRGARIVGVDRTSADLDRLAAEVPDATLVEADVTSEDAVRRYVEQARAVTGRIDIFFNNAGTEGEVHRIPDYPLDVFQRVLAVNVTGVFLGLKHVIPVMVEQGGGSIINTSSAAGLIGSAGLSAYVASKHAVIGLTRTAAAEWAKSGVRVNSVNPGPIQGRMMSSITEGWEPGQGEALAEQLAASVPSGRYGTVDEVASLVAFLASDEARHINGAVHSIDGGLTCV